LAVIVVVTTRGSACGIKPSRHSATVGTAEENNLTRIRTRAIYRGQYSIVQHRTFGLTLSSRLDSSATTELERDPWDRNPARRASTL
jgi:hypothetical protein